jgi:hypothetical protein
MCRQGVLFLVGGGGRCTTGPNNNIACLVIMRAGNVIMQAAHINQVHFVPPCYYSVVVRLIIASQEKCNGEYNATLLD